MVTQVIDNNPGNAEMMFTHPQEQMTFRYLGSIKLYWFCVDTHQWKKTDADSLVYKFKRILIKTLQLCNNKAFNV